MEKKKSNQPDIEAPNDKKLNQVARGDGFHDRDCVYPRTATIGGEKITCREELYYFCYKVLANMGQDEVIQILMSSDLRYTTRISLVEKYKKRGIDIVYQVIDMDLGR